LPTGFGLVSLDLSIASGRKQPTGTIFAFREPTSSNQTPQTKATECRVRERGHAKLRRLAEL
jgi:hypothetical protein